MNERKLLPMGVTREDFELFKTDRPAWEAKVRGRAVGELALRADASKPTAASAMAPAATQGQDATAIEKICRLFNVTPEEHALFLSDRPAWEKMVRERATQPVALMLRAATPAPGRTKDGGPAGVQRWEDGSTTAAAPPIAPDAEIIALAASYRASVAASKRYEWDATMRAAASTPASPAKTPPRGRIGVIKMVTGALEGDR